MSLLRIFLFGSVRITHDDRPFDAKATHSVQGLVAYLLLYRHRNHPREVLADLFWGDHREDRAHSCLNTALWRLRHVLEPEGLSRGTYLVTTPAGEVGFTQEHPYWLDVAAFEEQVGRGLAQPFEDLTAPDAEALEQSLQLYTGELLEGFYADWVLRERERLRLMYLNGLAQIMRYYRHRRAYRASLIWGQRILDLDPLREEIHRDMMRLYLDAGQRAMAVRQYETCRDILATEMGIPPMEETQVLYAQLKAAVDARQIQATHPGEAYRLEEIRRQLNLALQACESARKQMQQAIQLVEALTLTRSNSAADSMDIADRPDEKSSCAGASPRCDALVTTV